jgi:hypothetical protein
MSALPKSKSKQPKKTNIVTGGNLSYKVSSNVAPGARELDPNCRHGDPTDVRVVPYTALQTKCLQVQERRPHTMVGPGSSVVFAAAMSDFESMCASATFLRSLLLTADGRTCKDYWLRQLFASAVGGVCEEDGYAGFSRMKIVLRIVLDVLFAALARDFGDAATPVPQPLDAAWRTAAFADAIPQLREVVTDLAMYSYLHAPPHAVCQCMRFVVAAAADGYYDTAVAPKIKAVLSCPACNGVPANMKKCGGCMSVSYCNAACQTAHWPQHKAACKAMRKKANTSQ